MAAQPKSAPEPEKPPEPEKTVVPPTALAPPLVPDPLPPLNRPIFEAPHPVATHLEHLHPDHLGPAVTAAIEELRTRLGELREFLKRFNHDLGGDLGRLVDHLRVALAVPVHSHAVEEERRREDTMTVQRRHVEDAHNGGFVTPALREHRRAEDAGRDEMRRIMDTRVR